MKQINARIVYDWVGKVIHWDLGKKFKFNHTNKWNMLNPKSVLENEKTNFSGILRHNLGLTARPSDTQQKKKKKKKKKRSCRIVDFTVPADNRVKRKES